MIFFHRLPPPLLVKAFIDDGHQIQNLESKVKLLEESLLSKNIVMDNQKPDMKSNYSKAKAVPGSLAE